MFDVFFETLPRFAAAFGGCAGQEDWSQWQCQRLQLRAASVRAAACPFLGNSSNRSIFTRCCFTMTSTVQLLGNFY